MRLFAGTSGYSYAPWKGIFYPAKLPAARMLAHYATRLPSVEINNTFYRMPKADVVAGWAAQVPEAFRFAVKCPRRISHDQRLVDTDSALTHLADICASLGDRLGPILIQLPPFLKVDLPRLEAFLASARSLAPSLKLAFEFRHQSWFADPVFSALKSGGAALCIADDEKLSTPFEVTAPWGYARLRRPDYGPAEVAAWAQRFGAAPWTEAYVYFKHEDGARGPALAEALLAAS